LAVWRQPIASKAMDRTVTLGSMQDDVDLLPWTAMAPPKNVKAAWKTNVVTMDLSALK